jgi:penicillin-binding protein 2
VVGQANNALFIGYIIDEDNPLAIAVIVEEGGSGGGTAAPLAGEILRYAVNSKSN